MTIRRLIAMASALPVAALLAGCELGTKQSTQTGYRGAGLQQVSDPENFGAAAAIPDPPYPLPPDTGPLARDVYQNVPLLGDLSKDRFDHLMAAITQMVSPEQGCTYCHNPANLASDELYTKRVSGQMIQMTRAINSTWSNHVQQTGVTCWTCHRGNNIPENVWALDPATDDDSVRGQRRGQNAPNPGVGYTSLPGNVFASYFSGDAGAVRVASSNAYPTASSRLTGTRDAEDSYAIMMHVSQSLGVNCTYCHNSQSFRAWNLSRAQRATAWYGIRMVSNINGEHIAPLANVFPPNRLGPLGDPLKVNCLTCHQGQVKPLGGVSMLAEYPYFRAPGAAAPTTTAEEGVPEALERPGRMTQDSTTTAPSQPEDGMR